MVNERSDADHGAMRPATHPIAIITALALALALAGNAQASSLVYIHSNNIWLANPDGSGQYQVTLDGTAAEPYSSPSQAQDGTIVAVRGGKLYRMTQNGTLLNAPFSTSAIGTPPLDPLVSPDGSKVSFYSVTGVNPCWPWLCIGTAVSYQVTYSDHWVDPATFVLDVYGLTSYSNPIWLGNSRELLITRDAELWYYQMGSPEPVDWLSWTDVLELGKEEKTGFWDEAAASADGTRLALLALDEEAKQFMIQVYSTAGDLATGNPPAKPHAACAIPTPDGSVGSNDGTYPGSGWLFDSLSWSPDDSALAFEYNGTIYVAHMPDVTNCAGYAVTPVIANASDPNWGPANVNPAPRPAPPTPPAPPPPVVKPPPSPCAGLSGAAAQKCFAKQEYKEALNACAHKYAGHGTHAKKQRAACRRTAKAAYQRRLALLKCQKLKNRHARTLCVKKAKRS
jgi:hypothetical protein